MRILVVVAAAALALSACGGSAKPAAAKPAAAPKPNPTQACLQLQNWGLQNHVQGISKSFGRQLAQETAGTAMYVDVVQWLNDLRAPVPSPTGASQAISQLFADAGQVSSDCGGYGVRNILGN